MTVLEELERFTLEIKYRLLGGLPLSTDPQIRKCGSSKMHYCVIRRKIFCYHWRESAVHINIIQFSKW